MKWGIMSTGNIAHQFAAALKLAGQDLIAVSSRTQESADGFAGEFGLAKAYGSYRELYQDPDIDAVYVPTVNSLHYPCALEALKAGKHVIVEKPMTVSTAQRISLFEEAGKRGLFIAEGIKVLFLPAILEVKALIETGIYGRIRYMEFKQSYTTGRYATGWNKSRELGGGVHYGNEAYFLSVAELFGGEIIRYSGQRAYGPSGVEDQISISLLMKDNVIATSSVSTDILFDNGLIIYLEKARILIPEYWKARKAYVYANGELVKTIEHSVEHEMCYEIQHFSDCILSGKTCSDVVTPEMSIRYMRIAEELQNSWK